VTDRFRDGDLTNIYPRLPGYFTMDVRLGYTYKQFEVFGGVKNLTDAYYADFGGFRIGDARGFLFDYPHPGATFYGGVAVRF
jgi:outer membrane receptor protein involved in Fe transport